MKLRSRENGEEETIQRCQGDACELCRFEFRYFLIVLEGGDLERWHIIPKEADGS